LSAFWEDPRIYNPVSFLVCGALLLPWAVRTLRSKLSRPEIWLALATVIPITMLVSYHRPYDAKLLLLTVPACAMLWAKDGPLRWIVLVINSAGIILTQDIPLAILDLFSRGPRMRATGLWGRILVDLLLRPTPLILLLMGMIYLWVYLRREPERG
jgi:hypothetical protein